LDRELAAIAAARTGDVTMNKLRINAIVYGSLLALSLSGLAAAEEGGGHDGDHGKGRREAMAAHFFDKLDANKDGQVTKAEAEAEAKRIFDKLDANKDGEISHEEAEAGARALRQEGLTARFKELDTNKDGRLTQEESKLPARFFDKLDTNKDHALTLEEFEARPDFRAGHREFEFERADKNHDGKVTRAEGEQAAAERFDRVDANHDGVITREEFNAHLDKMMKLGKPDADAH